MENRKSQIVELALTFIQQKGYLSFSYDDLAKELGVSKASIHYHFAKKTDLGVAVCERIKDGLERSFLAVNHSSLNVREQPWAFIASRVKYIASDGICPISALQADFMFLPVSIQNYVKKIAEMEIHLLSELLRKGTNLAARDAETTAALLLSTTKGALQYRRVMGDALLSNVLDQLKYILKFNDKGVF
ncbi:TetR/AcrR family transcriptional regulator [Domibacillus aminovorans]|uniref:TetR family transcriptional regulator n=1 Tax=Domibacillus aminovorans TaxID=29332 RepID=A0A177L5J7_9BACI|nr:TetR/AcrR family transcriptional regulator [Domibacillus aminovorans]OAH60968.1 TetR family transcriptional regulator [Domibacillus aminovorans]